MKQGIPSKEIWAREKSYHSDKNRFSKRTILPLKGGEETEEYCNGEEDTGALTEFGKGRRENPRTHNDEEEI